MNSTASKRWFKGGAVAVLSLASVAVWLQLRTDPCDPGKRYRPVMPSHCCEAPRPTDHAHEGNPAVVAYLERTGESRLNKPDQLMFATGNWLCVAGEWEPEFNNPGKF